MGTNNTAADKTTQPTQPAEQSELLQKDITDTVMRKVAALEKDGAIKLPATYSAGNALKAAWLKIQTVQDKNKMPALQVCTRNSVANALFDMCIQGLSPAKNQCYFVVRGDQLTLMRSYFGTCAALKRLHGVEDVFAQVIYQDDVFEYIIERGNIVITKHEQKLENINLDKIVGAYSVIVKDDKPRCEVMTMAQIKQSWSHTTTGGGVQREYPDQMAKRTVINRGAKMYVNTSDDSDIMIESINRTTENEYESTFVENDEPLAFPEPAHAVLPEPGGQIELEIPDKKEPAPVETRRKPGF